MDFSYVDIGTIPNLPKFMIACSNYVDTLRFESQLFSKILTLLTNVRRTSFNVLALSNVIP